MFDHPVLESGQRWECACHVLSTTSCWRNIRQGRKDEFRNHVFSVKVSIKNYSTPRGSHGV